MELFILFLGIVLIPIAITDIRKYRVPNRYILFGWLLGIWNQWIHPGGSFLSWVMGFCLPILCLYPLFYVRMLGAGDIKLLSVIGSFLGVRKAAWTFLAALILGAVISVIRMMRYHMLIYRVQFLAQYISECFYTKQTTHYYEESQGRKPVIPFAAILALCAMGSIGYGWLHK